MTQFTMPIKNTPRLLWLDIMKGIGILMVMYSHFCHLPNYLIAGYMPLFFCISGLTYKPSTVYCKTVNAKAKRLLIPWLIYGLLIFFVDRAFEVLTHTFTIDKALQKFFGILYMRANIYWPYDETKGNMVSTNGPTWFLCTLFIVFLLMVAYERFRFKWVFVAGIISLAIGTYKMLFVLPWGAELALMGFLFVITTIHIKPTLIRVIGGG